MIYLIQYLIGSVFAVLNFIYSIPVADLVMYSGDNIVSCFFIGLLVAIVIAFSLISQSRTKHKATKAEKYLQARIDITERSDVYSHTTTKKAG